jgi:hypothetical protein
MATFRIASVEDTDEIMRFVHEHWRAGHILSTSRELFLHDFRAGDALNVAIAENDARDIVGMFGFFVCSRAEKPDMTGSIWMALELEESRGAFLGVKLRQFALDTIKPRHFATPGAGPQTRNVYRMLRMDWHRMRHLYLLNPEVEDFRIAVFPGEVPASEPPRASRAGALELCSNIEALGDFDFDAQGDIAPVKDPAYVQHRYLRHPIYNYLAYGWRLEGKLQNIIICRRATANGSSCLRVVDFFGDDQNLPSISPLLLDLIRQAGDEYLDFVCHGFAQGAMKAAGFLELDLNQQDLVVPNWFEPYTAANVSINCVSDRTTALRVRLCRADGDMDRPNLLPSESE